MPKVSTLYHQESASLPNQKSKSSKIPKNNILNFPNNKLISRLSNPSESPTLNQRRYTIEGVNNCKYIESIGYDFGLLEKNHKGDVHHAAKKDHFHTNGDYIKTLYGKINNKNINSCLVDKVDETDTLQKTKRVSFNAEDFTLQYQEIKKNEPKFLKERELKTKPLDEKPGPPKPLFTLKLEGHLVSPNLRALYQLKSSGLKHISSRLLCKNRHCKIRRHRRNKILKDVQISSSNPELHSIQKPEICRCQTFRSLPNITDELICQYSQYRRNRTTNILSTTPSTPQHSAWNTFPRRKKVRYLSRRDYTGNDIVLDYEIDIHSPKKLCDHCNYKAEEKTQKSLGLEILDESLLKSPKRLQKSDTCPSCQGQTRLCKSLDKNARLNPTDESPQLLGYRTDDFENREFGFENNLELQAIQILDLVQLHGDGPCTPS